MGPIRFMQTVQWKVVVLYVLLILIAMQVISAYFIKAAESYYTNNFTETLNAQANLLAVNVEQFLENPQSTSVEKMGELVQNLFTLREADVQVIDATGTVLVTTEENRGLLGQKNTRPEINVALMGTRSESIQYDPESKKRVKVLAVPIKKDGTVLGALFLVASIEEMYRTIRQIIDILATGTALSLLLTVGLGIILARTITTPVKEITRQVTQMANGNFSGRVRIYSKDEIGRLALAFNYLSERLKSALEENEEEREKLSSILMNMSDGVIATDREQKIILINDPARKMIGETGSEITGKNITEFIDLSKVDENGNLLFEKEVDGETRLVRMKFSSIASKEGKGKGIVAVLHDVTEEEALEKERKEFVANVSHELRTPLTTFKSYIEALLEGAVENREIAYRFLGVLSRETDRMTRLVNDLLQLSRFDAGQHTLDLRAIRLDLLLKDLHERYHVQSKQQNIALDIELPEDPLLIWVDKDGIIQVLDNLLSNAFKYSNEGTRIVVRATKQDEKWVRIEVIDQGIGIPHRDLSRIFERFYRVDKARSRAMGGTGLGLSIARQIILAHGGNIHIESEWQKGTKVSFTLPLCEVCEEVEENA